ncbi:hypothetical protein B0H34DRAFT_397154 [Crassisporium funariophilum]|nr:hypothetical protein B0H34DRAFT_397154 [Crassisporium funariophilum]
MRSDRPSLDFLGYFSWRIIVITPSMMINDSSRLGHVRRAAGSAILEGMLNLWGEDYNNDTFLLNTVYRILGWLSFPFIARHSSIPKSAVVQRSIRLLSIHLRYLSWPFHRYTIRTFLRSIAAISTHSSTWHFQHRIEHRRTLYLGDLKP